MAGLYCRAGAWATALSLLVTVGCREEPVVPGCGDGELAAGEVCDDGDANSDTAPDACRTTCLPSWCGDGVVDQGEACDDGNRDGADGCSPACEVEAGPFEVEPNDAWHSAGALDDAVDGSLSADDVDCFTIAADTCDAVRATVTRACSGRVGLSLHDGTGALVASGAPGLDGCTTLEPGEEPGARALTAGSYALCVAGPPGVPVPSYRLEAEVVSETFPESEGDDLDRDGIVDRCDLGSRR